MADNWVPEGVQGLMASRREEGCQRGSCCSKGWEEKGLQMQRVKGWGLEAGGSGGLAGEGQGDLGAGLPGSSTGGGALLTSGISLAGGLTPLSSGSPPRTRP